MRALVLALAACGSSPPPPAPPPAAPAPAAPAPSACGTAACSATEICVPGGASRNGIGETVMLPPAHCVAIPAACNGVATCGCIGNMCALGGCASIDAGRLICLAG